MMENIDKLIDKIKELRDEHRKISEEQNEKYVRLIEDLENEKELSKRHRIARRMALH